ncbi:hypothetical protein [Shewanella fidelis]|uniref:Phosphate ABC transporter substrate-binding protein n=1 Tax=Shewanella fidelis TaxID=173509 RepID=A0AAW8NT42_9GAMM|nr:hypothetical protein [Shewanella fidelis]MDR8526132.1 hypothetical protein [Shewanella fidelis]MDW4813745.1 hypothetical protein [Shewanella fidelis]MDW4817841.1 hypothetical protein [Shewanella fidelis]MDW4821898.1 hypothetical protein [Shewanella fidelis]MDW4826073.1 hypothetical protein [Shewanella fidelis]
MFKGLNKLIWHLYRSVFIALPILLISMSVTAVAEDADVEFAIFSLNDELPQLSQNKARMLYRGKSKRISGSLKIVLVDLPETSIHREEFYKMLLGKSVSQMNGYWAGLAFSGKGSPPEELDSDDIKQILNWLNDNPNGIAYAPIESVPEEVNILITVPQGE